MKNKKHITIDKRNISNLSKTENANKKNESKYNFIELKTNALFKDKTPDIANNPDIDVYCILIIKYKQKSNTAKIAYHFALFK